MKHISYVGSGPYCYSNSFSMMLGSSAPSTSVIEFATGSPFGMQIVGGNLPFFDPYGWTPEAGFDSALEAMGWSSHASSGGRAEDALERLRAALDYGPVWAGPVEMGWLRHQPGKIGPIAADHYVVVLSIEDGWVRLHDPEGHPFVRLPQDDFMAAWEGATVDHGAPYTMRYDFRRRREVREEDVIRASIPSAIRSLSMECAQHLPEGTIGNGEAAEALASTLERGCSDQLRSHLVEFAIRVGARRLADAATCLERVNYAHASQLMSEQAQLVGALQYPLVVGHDCEAATIVRKLTPTYPKLLAALQ